MDGAGRTAGTEGDSDPFQGREPYGHALAETVNVAGGTG